MEKIFHWTNTFKSLGEDDDGGVKIRGLASTNALDRQGDTINHDAWIKKGGLNNYQQNPIILFNHDYNKPIGRATSMEVTNEGLELGAKISKSAGEIKDLIKDGVLGAFSVGFRVKDADYNEETDGLKIKDAELFEVSVVSVPANQTAMFSLSKSFDSMEEYDKFKQQFYSKNVEEAHSKDSAKTDEIDAPQAADNSVKQEKSMSTENETPNAQVDLESYAEELAEKAAAKLAMKQAETKAKEKAEAEEAAELEAQEKAADEAEATKVKKIVEVGMSGAERLMNDVEKRVSEKHENLEQVVNELKTELSEKKGEIEAIRESKSF